MECTVQRDLDDPDLPQHPPLPTERGARLERLVHYHAGGPDCGCDWCLLVAEITRLRDRLEHSIRIVPP